MRRYELSILGLVLLLGACAAETSLPPVEVKASAPPISFLEDVKPILDARCVVCHSCYNAPCQLQLGSFEGIDRGGSKAAVYSSSRLRPQDPTQLFMDAQSTPAWREKGFHSVLENTAPGDLNDSILLGLLEAKRRQPTPTGEYEPEASDLACPATRPELADFLARHPERGMPFGFPPLSEHEFATIAAWLQQGAPGPGPQEQHALVTPSPGAAQQIADWEAFLNRDDAKHAMTAKASRTSSSSWCARARLPGSRSPFSRRGAPMTPSASGASTTGSGRSTRRSSTRPTWWSSSTRRASHASASSSSSPSGSANPFRVYAQIPPDSRYRFLLDDAEYFIRTFIRGPVCRGQVALNVIHDHFWILFRDPDRDQTVLHPQFLVDQAENLALPDEQGSNELLIRTFSDAYRSRYKKFYRAKTRLYEQTAPAGFGLEDLWPGRRASDAPLLTVYRHFDSASVHRGPRGNLPRTLWVIDYSQFERIYYALVAGFDVYGNVSHQVNVRRYMDFLRVEGELNFVKFLPPEHRLPMIRSWYLGDRAVENIDPEDVLGEHGTKFVYRTDDPKRELIEAVVDEYLPRSLGIGFDSINYQRHGDSPPMPTSFTSHEDILDGFRALTAPGTGFIRHVTDTGANVILVRVKNYEGEDHFFTIVINRWHDNVNTMFGEEKRLDPSKDTIDFLRGSIGSYPNYFLLVEAEELPELFDVLENFDGSEAFKQRFHALGIDRADPHVRLVPTAARRGGPAACGALRPEPLLPCRGAPLRGADRSSRSLSPRCGSANVPAGHRRARRFTTLPGRGGSRSVETGVGPDPGQAPCRDLAAVEPPEPPLELLPPREQPPREDLLEGEPPRRDPEPHRGRRRLPPLRTRLYVVAPHGPDREPIERPLYSLGERDGLPLLVRTAGPNQEIGQVRGEEGVSGRPGLPRRGRLVPDRSAREPSDRPRVACVLVRPQGGGGAVRDDPGQELLDGLARRLGIRPPVAFLELVPLHPLPRRHRAAPPQLGLVEAVDVVGSPDEEVQVVGPVLARLEAAEPIEDEGLPGHPGTEPLVEEEAVASEPLDLALDGGVRDAELLGDLAQAAAAADAEEELAVEIRALEPVVGGEGL
jgi:hypothetical protein